MNEYNIASDGLNVLKRVLTPQGVRYQTGSLNLTLEKALEYWSPKSGTHNGLFYAALLEEKESESA